MGKKKHISGIIGSYLDLEDTSETVRKAFGTWLLADADQEEKQDALGSVWDKKCTALESSLREAVGCKPESGRRGFFMPWYGAVAAVLALFAVAALNLIPRGDVITDEIRYVAGEDSKGAFSLPDGSRVWLNSNSVLSYKSSEGKDWKRHVSVDGEAFFDVVKDRTPFTVSLGDDIMVKVHGTRFNVRNTGIFENVQVTLQSGEVEVDDSGRSVMLTPGTCYTCNAVLGTYSLNYVNSSNFSNWTRPFVVFKDQPLSDVLITLEHWYNTKITVEKGIDTTLSLSFTLKRETVHDTFSLLQKLTGYRCSVVDSNHIVISK